MNRNSTYWSVGAKQEWKRRCFCFLMPENHQTTTSSRKKNIEVCQLYIACQPVIFFGHEPLQGAETRLRPRILILPEEWDLSYCYSSFFNNRGTQSSHGNLVNNKTYECLIKSNRHGISMIMG